ncbi:MAG: hypothetical protein N2509_08625 [Treponemataceae bacterium]|nr:hypothetical protein [Treponemataceae bacterium]
MSYGIECEVGCEYSELSEPCPHFRSIYKQEEEEAEQDFYFDDEEDEELT